MPLQPGAIRDHKEHHLVCVLDKKPQPPAIVYALMLSSVVKSALYERRGSDSDTSHVDSLGHNNEASTLHRSSHLMSEVTAYKK